MWFIMAVNKRFLITLSALLALSSYASAFFFSWGADTTTQPPVRYYYYQKRQLHGPVPAFDQQEAAETNNAISNTQPMALPTVPVQVPLQAQLAPAPVHNVQLVPCLCPITQDFPQSGEMDGVGSPDANNNMYMSKSYIALPNNIQEKIPSKK